MDSSGEGGALSVGGSIIKRRKRISLQISVDGGAPNSSSSGLGDMGPPDDTPGGRRSMRLRSVGGPLSMGPLSMGPLNSILGLGNLVGDLGQPFSLLQSLFSFSHTPLLQTSFLSSTIADYCVICAISQDSPFGGLDSTLSALGGLDKHVMFGDAFAHVIDTPGGKLAHFLDPPLSKALSSTLSSADSLRFDFDEVAQHFPSPRPGEHLGASPGRWGSVYNMPGSTESVSGSVFTFDRANVDVGSSDAAGGGGYPKSALDAVVEAVSSHSLNSVPLSLPFHLAHWCNTKILTPTEPNPLLFFRLLSGQAKFVR